MYLKFLIKSQHKTEKNVDLTYLILLFDFFFNIIIYNSSLRKSRENFNAYKDNVNLRSFQFVFCRMNQHIIIITECILDIFSYNLLSHLLLIKILNK